MSRNPDNYPVSWILWPLGVFIVVVIIACCHGCSTPRGLDARDPVVIQPKSPVSYPTPR